MTVTVRQRVRQKPAARRAPRPAYAPPVETPPPSGASRWFLVLGVPFVLGAGFFGLAIGLDAEWPMVPAVLLGPVLLISAYLYLSLTSDTNTTG
jgi:hypothetical protein